ncbi:hypothetical protein [Nocardia amikacinitolerans]|uniref:hypothetical protein n=1 Tax=Nocardia amikacinitolerans TaxID=756689 RepID=UPI0015CA4CDE|nr:hypothetical protein [Nocardia amikacinitolerans]
MDLVAGACWFGPETGFDAQSVEIACCSTDVRVPQNRRLGSFRRRPSGAIL